MFLLQYKCHVHVYSACIVSIYAYMLNVVMRIDKPVICGQDALYLVTASISTHPPYILYTCIYILADVLCLCVQSLSSIYAIHMKLQAIMLVPHTLERCLHVSMHSISCVSDNTSAHVYSDQQLIHIVRPSFHTLTHNDHFIINYIIITYSWVTSI